MTTLTNQSSASAQSGPREMLNKVPEVTIYLLVILFTFALGTAGGDLIAEKFSLGYAPSVGLFAATIAVIAIAHFRFRLNPILSFWLAYIMTRPLGASIGDEMSQSDPSFGGLGLGSTTTSYVFLGLILALVTYLTMTGTDRTERRRARAVADQRRAADDHRAPRLGIRSRPAHQEA